MNKLKSFKVNLEYYPGHYCSPQFIDAVDIVQAGKQAYEKFATRFHIKEILEDKYSTEQRLFQVTYFKSKSDGYDDDIRSEHHRGFVKGHTEQEAWINARSKSKNVDYWVEYVKEVKANSMEELMNYLIKNFA